MAHDIIPQLTQWEYDHSLGHLAVWWIETFTLIGRGDGIGLPMHFDLDEYQFMVGAYALKRNGKRKFNRLFLSRAKGRDKSGKAAGVGMFEGFGPCRFDHWAREGETYTFMGETYEYHEGEPVGKPVTQPEVVCLANSEQQAGQRVRVHLLQLRFRPLVRLEGHGMDVGTNPYHASRGRNHHAHHFWRFQSGWKADHLWSCRRDASYGAAEAVERVQDRGP